MKVADGIAPFYFTMKSFSHLSPSQPSLLRVRPNITEHIFDIHHPIPASDGPARQENGPSLPKSNDGAKTISPHKAGRAWILLLGVYTVRLHQVKELLHAQTSMANQEL